MQPLADLELLPLPARGCGAARWRRRPSSRGGSVPSPASLSRSTTARRGLAEHLAGLQPAVGADDHRRAPRVLAGRCRAAKAPKSRMAPYRTTYLAMSPDGRVVPGRERLQECRMARVVTVQANNIRPECATSPRFHPPGYTTLAGLGCDTRRALGYDTLRASRVRCGAPTRSTAGSRPRSGRPGRPFPLPWGRYGR